MSSQSSVFAHRLRRIDKKHRKMADGRRTMIDESGLVQELPKRNLRLPLRGIMFAVFALIGFKGWLLYTLGPTDYIARLDALASGTLVEQLGSAVMRPDPVALQIAEALARFF